MRRFAGRATSVLKTLVIAYLLIVVLLMIFEESFIFFPSRYPSGDWQPAGLNVEDAWIESADGTRIHGWYLPHDRARATDAHETVLYCHGNGGNLSHRAEVLRTLQDRVGVSVLIFDYRGYGQSEGKPTESGVLDDARSARAWLADREGIDEADIVLLGRSLGGAVAVHLAAELGARALVLESTFTSIPDMAGSCYPWLPARWLVRTQLDSLGKIGSYRGPLLQSHGDADTIVPYSLGRRLFDAANEPKEFLTLSGLDHNIPQPPSYYDRLAEFLDGLDGQTPP